MSGVVVQRFEGLRICGRLCDVEVRADLKEPVSMDEAKEIGDAMGLVLSPAMGRPSGAATITGVDRAKTYDEQMLVSHTPGDGAGGNPEAHHAHPEDAGLDPGRPDPGSPRGLPTDRDGGIGSGQRDGRPVPDLTDGGPRAGSPRADHEGGEA